MRSEEDEAFDDLAKKQGSWGGGFPAKRKMAADKQHWNEDEWRRNNWRCQHGWLRGEQCEICNASLAPKPAHCQCTACKDGIFHASDCAVHNGPAYPAGPCDCGVAQKHVAVISAWSLREVYFDEDGEPSMHRSPPQRERVLFPTMLRKMWSGGEVQAWLDENVNKEQNNGA
jgi:hypothetical protein